MKTILYHGSPEIIKKPVYGKGKHITTMDADFTARSIWNWQRNGRAARI